MTDRTKIDRLFEGEKPYEPSDVDELPTVKVLVDGIGWVAVKTKTEFLINGMLSQARDKIAAGDYVKCDPPKKDEVVIPIKP